MHLWDECADYPRGAQNAFTQEFDFPCSGWFLSLDNGAEKMDRSPQTVKLDTQKGILCSAPSARVPQPPFIILCRAPSPFAAEDGRWGALVRVSAETSFAFW